MEGKTVERFEVIKVALSFAQTEREAFKLADRILNFVHQVNEVPEPSSKPVTAADTAKNIKPKTENRGRKRSGETYTGYTSADVWFDNKLLAAVKMRENGSSISEIADFLGYFYSAVYPVIRSYDDKYPPLMDRIASIQKK